jgi:hypothetical protein
MIPVFCGRSLVVKHQLPKLRLRVRFSSPAPNFKKQSDLFGLFFLFNNKRPLSFPRQTTAVFFQSQICLFIPLFLMILFFFLFNRHIPQSAISAPKDSMIFLSIFLLQGRYCIPAVRLLSSTSGTGVAASSNRISLK